MTHSDRKVRSLEEARKIKRQAFNVQPLRHLEADVPAHPPIQPCPATITGPFLGISADGDAMGKTVTLRCAHLVGHDGPHYVHVEWGGE